MMDLTNGIAAHRDYVLPACPQDPAMRESVSLWLFAEDGSIGLPRIGIEAEATNWDDRLFQCNMAFADGRVLIGPGRGKAHPPLGEGGVANVIGAGPLRFTCVEPFRRWQVAFDGDAADGHVRQQMDGSLDQRKRSKLQFRFDLEMVVPAWGQDNSIIDLASLTAAQRADAESMGIGYRFEQLLRATGSVTVDGVIHQITCTGLRIHRQSARPLGGFRGHCWQSAVFPDGRAFGYIAYPPREDGSFTYNEGYLWDGQRMIPARVAEAPWLRNIMPMGDDVSLVLESELGRTAIKGTTALSTFRVGNPDIGGLNLQQSGALYGWEGMQAYGMIERSNQESLTRIIPDS